jgi:hypothetical protein
MKRIFYLFCPVEDAVHITGHIVLITIEIKLNQWHFAPVAHSPGIKTVDEYSGERYKDF